MWVCNKRVCRGRDGCVNRDMDMKSVGVYMGIMSEFQCFSKKELCHHMFHFHHLDPPVAQLRNHHADV